MALNIKNREVEVLANEVAELSGETMTGAVLTALRERRERLRQTQQNEQRLADTIRFLERRVWPLKKRKKTTHG